jgi:hypothetical protein
MRWSTKQRIAFIADHLKVAGKINRRDIMEKFEVSAPQAAADFRHFEKAHPGAMRYDASLKAYVPGRGRRRSKGGRDTSAAANRLMRADDEELKIIIRHDPGMIRDVAAALIYERDALASQD